MMSHIHGWYQDAELLKVHFQRFQTPIINMTKQVIVKNHFSWTIYLSWMQKLSVFFTLVRWLISRINWIWLWEKKNESQQISWLLIRSARHGFLSEYFINYFQILISLTLTIYEHLMSNKMWMQCKLSLLAKSAASCACAPGNGGSVVSSPDQTIKTQIEIILIEIIKSPLRLQLNWLLPSVDLLCQHIWMSNKEEHTTDWSDTRPRVRDSDILYLQS